MVKCALPVVGSKTDTIVDIMVLFVLVFVFMRVAFRMFVNLLKLIKATAYGPEVTVKMKFGVKILNALMLQQYMDKGNKIQ